MPNKLFWLRVAIDDFRKATIGLTPEQLGAAWHLVEASWEQEPPCTLPNDPTFLASASQLFGRWRQQASALLGLWAPTDDGRLAWSWLTAVYESQLGRYEKRSNANRGNRAQRGKRSTNRTTNGSTNRTTNRTTNGANSDAGETSHDPPIVVPTVVPIVVPLSRENLELRRSLEGSYEPSKASAPDAGASADEARAALGASEETGVGAPGDDSDSGRAVETRRAGGQPESISDVIQQLRPPGAVLRPSVAKERELALAWACDHPEEAEAIELRLREEWPRAKDQQLRSMLVTAFAKAMNGAAQSASAQADAAEEVTP